MTEKVSSSVMSPAATSSVASSSDGAPPLAKYSAPAGNELSSAVTVCASAAPFVHVTVSPAEIVMLSGAKARSPVMLTEGSLFEQPADSRMTATTDRRRIFMVRSTSYAVNRPVTYMIARPAANPAAPNDEARPASRGSERVIVQIT